ncbi:MAG: nitroreductase family protein [Cellvibrionaceae bacterium]|nr:nitroreductase family protein [Cellvibrionaceae bacterium]
MINASSIVSNVIKNRQSTKLFDDSAEMPANDFEEILLAASMSPSAFNIQHWRIVRVKDKKIRMRLSTIAWSQPQIMQASEVLLVCADLKAWQKQMLFCHSTNNEDKKNFSKILEKIYSENTLLQRDEAMRSACLFSMTLMIKAESLGYQTCPMSGFDYRQAKVLLALDDNVEPCMIIALGKEKMRHNHVKRQYKYRIPLEKILIS